MSGPVPTEAEKGRLPTTSSIVQSSNDSSSAIAHDGDASSPKGSPPGGPSQTEFPPQRTVMLVMAAMFTAAFLVALDRTIIATAIPKITDDFHSLGDIGWYASAYLLTACSFQLLTGRIYTFYNPKWVFLINIAIFEIGSIICGAAPNSTAFIVGRAVAGLGSSGMFSGVIILMVHTVPLHKRPAYTGVFGMVFGVASVIGPLLGGAFTDGPSWRWCFWINLPLGGIAMVVIALVLKLPDSKRDKLTLTQQLHKLDPVGTAVFLPSVVCLLLALQWGGTVYPWSDARIIALLTLCPIFLAAFVVVQLWKKETATVPPRIIKQRSVAAGMWLAFSNGASMMTLVYYLPVWFQAIKAVDAEKSGLMVIPLVLALVAASMLAGFATRKIGYFTQWIYLSAIIMPIGAGLITTFTPTTNHARWIGYQVIYGFGLGLGMQQPSVSVQTNLEKKDVPTGASLIFFSQTLGGAIFTSVGNNVFDNKLVRSLLSIAGLDAAAVVRAGATELRQFVKPHQLPAVIRAYNGALVDCFDVALAMSCMAILGAVWVEWKSIKQGAPQAKDSTGVKKGEVQRNDEKV